MCEAAGGYTKQRTYRLVWHVDINGIGKLLERVTQIVLEVPLFAFIAAFLILLLLDNLVMQLTNS